MKGFIEVTLEMPGIKIICHYTQLSKLNGKWWVKDHDFCLKENDDQIKELIKQVQ